MKMMLQHLKQYSVQSIPYTWIYIALAFFSAIGFKFFPMIIYLPIGGAWTPWVMANGLFLVLRDFCQRELGHQKVLLAMAAVITISVTINPGFFIVTLAGIIAGETIDWLVYTYSKRPFGQRILLSSLISAPVETVVIIGLIDFLQLLPFSIFGVGSILTGIFSRLLAAFIIFYLHQKRSKGLNRSNAPTLHH